MLVNPRLGTLLVLAALVFFNGACSRNSTNSSLDSSDDSTAIIGGELATNQKSPIEKHLVAVYSKGGSLCTGTLIKKNIVLTAAHCAPANPRDVYVIFAPDISDLYQEWRPEDMITILEGKKEISIHKRLRRGVNVAINPNWEEKTTSRTQSMHDTALIRFGGTAPKGYAPATLLRDSSVLKEGAPVVVAGYGVAEIKRKTVSRKLNPDGEVSDYRRCLPSLDGETEVCSVEKDEGSGYLRYAQVKVAGPLNSTEIALEQNEGKAACRGDSGGPAFIRQAKGSYVLFGVASRVTKGCNNLAFYSDLTTPELKTWLGKAVVEVALDPKTPKS